jgi:predicted esterase YcpF (UPF0227 family)
MAEVGRLIESAGAPPTLVGSSLGGHYATYLAEKYALSAILVNPAVVSRLDLARFVGEHANFHSGERFVFTPAHVAELRVQQVQPSPARYWLLAETGDTVLDARQAVDFYAGCRQDVLPGGDHSFTRFPDFIPQILEYAGL